MTVIKTSREYFLSSLTAKSDKLAKERIVRDIDNITVYEPSGVMVSERTEALFSAQPHKQIGKLPLTGDCSGYYF